MLILAIDTSTRTGSAAILRDDHVLEEVSGFEETPYSARLFRDVETLQSRAKFHLDQVDLFAVSAGPGSFTGLRVGLTAVKAWAEVHQKPVAAISGLEAIAAQIQTGRTRGTHSTTTGTMSRGYIVPFLDARRGQIFGAAYKNNSDNGFQLALEGEESIVSPDEFLESVKQRIRSDSVDFVSPTPDAIPVGPIEELFPTARVIPVSAALAPAIGRLGFERATRGDLVDALRLDANYLRRSDAEATWKDG